MAKFDVGVHRTIYVNLFLEADTKEEAEKLATEQMETSWKDLNYWNEYPSERSYQVQELKR